MNGAAPSELAAREVIAAATTHQPRARAALTAALAGTPSHAYLFRGPRGSGKERAMRAFAVELLADGAPDPDDARRRAMLDPTPHPDLAWLTPPGAWHLVEDVRESVIRAASLRPAEGEHRVFVIAQAEALRDESQNALLKTLEEPGGFAHILLSCSDPDLLAPTIASRCQPVIFSALPPAAVAGELADAGLGAADDPVIRAASRLCGGDLSLGRLLASPEGAEVRARAERAARAPLAGVPAPWQDILTAADNAGAAAGEEAERLLTERLAMTGGTGRGARAGRAPKLTREHTDQIKRSERRVRTEIIDLGLALCAAWYRDLAASSAGAAAHVFHTDRSAELAEDAARTSVPAARRAVELVAETRRRLDVNVSEELALEALWVRLENALT